MLNNLKIWQRFALVAVAFLVPVGLLLYVAVQSQNYQVAFADQEMKGTAFERPFKKFFAHLLEHRDLAASRQVSEALAAQAEKAAVDVDDDLKRVEEADRSVGASLGTSDELASLKALWLRLKADAPTMDSEQALEAHNRLLRAVSHLNITFGNASNLILDPDVDTYYAMDATTFKIYKLMDELSQMRAIGTVALAKPEGLDAVTRSSLASLATRADDSLNTLNVNMEFGLDASPLFDSTARPALQEATTAVRTYLSGTGARAARGERSDLLPADFWASTTQAIAATSKLHDVVLGELERMLQARSAALKGRRNRDLGLVLGAIALASLFLVLAIRSVTRPVNALRAAAEKISLGEMDAKLPVADKSELGALAESFRRMQTSLATAMEALRRR